MKKIVSRLMLVMVITMMLVGMTPVMASAKTVKLKAAAFTTSTATAEAVARPVGRGKMTVSVPKKGSGYLKFVAPASKAYSFTFSNIRSGRYNCGHTYLMTTYGRDNASITMNKVGTQGGESSSLYIATKNSKYGEKAYRYLKKRTGNIFLQQGQTVYIFISMVRKCTLQLKIK